LNFKGNIFYINSKVVKGWAFQLSDKEKFARVKLYVNGAEIQSMLAQEPLKKLKENKIHSTGNCGFTFNLNEHAIVDGDKVEVKIVVKKKEYTLENKNPIYFSKNFKISDAIKNQIAQSKNNRILIIGLHKSGTTALIFKIAKSLNDPEIKFEPKKQNGLIDVKMHQDWLNINNNLVCKCLFFPPYKNYIEHIIDLYKNAIWIFRDPRDQIISAILYRWFWKHKNVDRSKLKTTLNLLTRKENNPKSVNFIDIIDAGINITAFKNAQQNTYTKLLNIYTKFNTDKRIFFFPYKDLVTKNFSGLEKYLELELKNEPEENATLNRVKRTASYDNWKNWFTEEDVEFFKPIYTEFLKTMGFDEDWTLNANPSIDKKVGSEYVKKLSTQPNFFNKLLSRVRKS